MRVVATALVVLSLSFPIVAAEAANAPRPGETRVMGGGGRQFTGARISLDFKDADVKDVLRFLADFGGFNLVLDSSVQGKITIKLNDVPWDQALDIILRNNGLAADLEGSVVRAAGLTVLAREEQEQRRLAEERALAGPLVTVTRTLSYAKAEDVAKLVDHLLTPRGTIIVDRRTNTLIITDLATRKERLSAELDALDR